MGDPKLRNEGSREAFPLSEGRKSKKEVVTGKYRVLLERAQDEKDIVTRRVLRTALEELLKGEETGLMVKDLVVIAEECGLTAPDFSKRPAKNFREILDAFIPLEPRE